MATVDYKANILNLYSDESTDQKHFQLQPLGDKLSVSYKYGAGATLTNVPIHMDLLELQDGLVSVNVVSKMNLNATNIANEISRALAKEAVIDSDVLAEIARAGGVEAQLQSDLDAEELARQQADTNFSNSLAQEVSDRQGADTTLTNNLTFEVNRAQSAEGVLTTNLNAEITLARANEQQVASDLADYETSNDTKLDAQILKEGNYETSNDTKVDGVIADLAQEVSDRSSAVSAEQTARANAVANLQSQIDFVISNTDPVALDSLTEIVAKFNQDGATYASRLDSIEATLTALVNQH